MQNNVAAFDPVVQCYRVWCGRIAEILAQSMDPDWLAMKSLQWMGARGANETLRIEIPCR